MHIQKLYCIVLSFFEISFKTKADDRHTQHSFLIHTFAAVCSSAVTLVALIQLSGH